MRGQPETSALVGFTLLLHLAFAGRYDFFRDELYFIVCGRHPAFGYVDQPPLVPLLAAATQLFGESLFLLRVPVALASAATVGITCALARLVGAGRLGATIAGIAAAVAPMYLGLTCTLNTTAFEPLAWTLVIYLVGRAVVFDERRAWLWVGVVVGIDLQIKYSIPMFLVPLALALVITGRGRALFCRELLIGIGIATVIAAPNAIWQLTHGLPFLEMVENQSQGKNVVLSPPAFVLNQLKVMNPLLAPLWLAGAIAPLVDRRADPEGRRLREWRFASVAFLLTFALMIAIHAKDYYFAPAYAAMFAIGGAVIEARVRSRALVVGWLVPAVALSAVAAPLALPILDPPALVAYQRALHLTPQAAETGEQSELPQMFADMVGWRSYVRSVADAYRALPEEERARAALFTGNYGEAAALDFFGGEYGLPPALSGHNQYWMWGPRGYDGSILIRINQEPESLAPRCASVVLLGRFGAPYVMPYENDAPITLCRGLHPPLSELWAEVKRFY